MTSKAKPARRAVTKRELEKLVLSKAVGEWGCEDLTGVTVEACDPVMNGRNWTVTHLQNEDLPAAEHTIWPAPGFEDTEFGVFMEPRGRTWRDGSSHESSSLRR